MRGADEPPHFLVHELGCGLAEWLLHQRLSWPCEIVTPAPASAHPELYDLGTGALCDSFRVALAPVVTRLEEQLLSHAAASMATCGQRAAPVYRYCSGQALA